MNKDSNAYKNSHSEAEHIVPLSRREKVIGAGIVLGAVTIGTFLNGVVNRQVNAIGPRIEQQSLAELNKPENDIAYNQVVILNPGVKYWRAPLISNVSDQYDVVNNVAPDTHPVVIPKNKVLRLDRPRSWIDIKGDEWFVATSLAASLSSNQATAPSTVWINRSELDRESSISGVRPYNFYDYAENGQRLVSESDYRIHVQIDSTGNLHTIDKIQDKPIGTMELTDSQTINDLVGRSLIPSIY